MNAGFLRQDAYLGIVFITNEDDCSAQNPGVFTNQSTDFFMSSRLGPPGNFRCAEFGYLCGGARPSRNAPNGLETDTRSLTDCVSEEAGELMPWPTVVAGEGDEAAVAPAASPEADPMAPGTGSRSDDWTTGDLAV